MVGSKELFALFVGVFAHEIDQALIWLKQKLNIFSGSLIEKRPS